MFGKADEIQIEILEDGTIKSTTDKVSGANHANAEQFLRYVGQLAGGETTTRNRKGHHHTHGHDHTHDHDHDHLKG